MNARKIAWDAGGSDVAANPVEIKHRLTIGEENILQLRYVTATGYGLDDRGFGVRNQV